MINALNDSQLVNKKSELINTCRHQNKLLLKSLKESNRKHEVWIRNLYVLIRLYSCCNIYILCFRY